MDCVFTGLTEEQKQIKALVRGFFKKEVDPKRIKAIEEKVFNATTCEEVNAVFPRDLLRKLHEAGLRQVAIPEKYGGTEPESNGNTTRAMIAEEAGYISAEAGHLLASTYMICRVAVASPYVTEKQKEQFYTSFMKNPEAVLAGSVSEPSGGTDVHLPYEAPGVGNTDLFARKEGNEWVINGNKMFCSGGAVADIVTLAARTDKNGPITESTTQFLVPTNTPGLSRTLNRFAAIELGGNAQFFFDNVRLPESLLIGEVNKGYNSMIEASMVYKWMMLAAFVGEIQRVYDDTRNYAKERIQGGKPIIQHSHIAAALGAIGVKIEALKAFTCRLAYETDQWEKFGGSMNTFWSQGYLYLFKKTGWELAEIANEIYGGLGKSLDMPLEKFARRMFTFTAAGSSTSINVIKCSKEYEDRFQF